MAVAPVLILFIIFLHSEAAPMDMTTLYDYLRAYAPELGRRIVETYAPLHAPSDPPAPELRQLLRTPLPAQELAIMGSVKYLRDHDAVKIVGECGTGKTFMAGAGICYVAAHGRPYSTIVMCPPHLTEKWAREVLIAVPGAQTFIIEDLRNPTKNPSYKSKAHGVVQIQLLKGKMTRKGLQTSLPKLREMGRKRWLQQHPGPSYFIVGKEKGKLGYFWKHVYGKGARSSEHAGGVVNPDTHLPVAKSSNGVLDQDDFDERKKHAEVVERGQGADEQKQPRSHGGSQLFSPLWAADRSKIQRMAPMEFMGRYMLDWFDFSIADEVHQLSGDTAQGNGLAVLARIAKKVITLTGTMMGGYADDLFPTTYRTQHLS
jgi:Type III restriction enzyme, res subunit